MRSSIHHASPSKAGQDVRLSCASQLRIQQDTPLAAHTKNIVRWRGDNVSHLATLSHIWLLQLSNLRELVDLRSPIAQKSSKTPYTTLT
jgi:hypothetical protein